MSAIRKPSDGPPGYSEFFGAAYKHISKAMKEMADDPRAEAFPRDVMLTALACACIKTCALTITASGIGMKDVKWLSRMLSDEVKNFRDRFGARGTGTMQQ